MPRQKLSLVDTLKNLAVISKNCDDKNAPLLVNQSFQVNSGYDEEAGDMGAMPTAPGAMPTAPGTMPTAPGKMPTSPASCDGDWAQYDTVCLQVITTLSNFDKALENCEDLGGRLFIPKVDGTPDLGKFSLLGGYSA